MMKLTIVLTVCLSKNRASETQLIIRNFICRNSRTTGHNPHQSVPSVTSQHVASSQTGTSVEMYRII